MPKQYSHKLFIRNTGFTLIEILLVMGIIGILAVAVMVFINPLEQMRKTRDTTKKFAAVEYRNATSRYYANQGQYPWYPHLLDPARLLNNLTLQTQALIDIGELKKNFVTNLPSGAVMQISVANTVANGNVVVCFEPESKTVGNDPATVFITREGIQDLTNCPDPTGATTCYWCAI